MPYRCQVVQPADVKKRPALSRADVVARALAVGTAEGLDAVSLRRVASELGVTPMALYRHVHDKQDLLNAMLETVLDGFDVSSGLDRSLPWTEQLRAGMLAYKIEMDARPLALPLSIAYTGEGNVAFWRMLEDFLRILLAAGFSSRRAFILIRVISNLLAGYLLLLRDGAVPESVRLDPRQLDLVRRRMELSTLTLPADQYPNLVAGADDLAEVWISDPDRWWSDTVDLIVFGLERMLEVDRESAAP